jgi:hypothetical protein
VQTADIVELVAAELHLKVLDKAMLSCVAEKCGVSDKMVESVDEESCDAAWCGDMLTYWFNQRVIPQLKYVRHLGQCVVRAAQKGRSLFVGRGAHFFLPRDRGLVARIVSPRKERTERIMKCLRMGHEQAAAYVDQQDKARRLFIARYFHQDITDPYLYDLVLNTDQMGAEEAAELLVDAYRRRFAQEGRSADTK